MREQLTAQLAGLIDGSDQLSRGGRRLKLRYRGTAPNKVWLKNRTAALNLRNLIGRGLNQRDGAWAIA